MQYGPCRYPRYYPITADNSAPEPASDFKTDLSMLDKETAVKMNAIKICETTTTTADGSLNKIVTAVQAQVNSVWLNKFTDSSVINAGECHEI